VGSSSPDLYAVFDEDILPDQRWQRLTAKFPLPIKARHELVTAIRAYRSMKTSDEFSRSPSQTKTVFRKAARHSAAVAETLSTFGFDDWYHLSEVDHSDVEVVSRKLQQVRSDCLLLQRWLVEGQAKIRSGKTNTNAQPLRDFLMLVDIILIECKGSGLKTSNGREKQFVVDLCKMVDKSIGPGSINEAIAFTISNRRRRVFFTSSSDINES
jgi:hypothetical protein